MQPAGGVAGLDVDQQVVDDDRRDAEVGLAEDAGQPPQHACLGAQLEVVDRVLQPAKVAALVLERRLVELHVPLLQRRAEDHLPPDADRGGLRAGDERRHLDLEVRRRLGAAGETPARLELLRREGARVEWRGRHVALLDPDAALLARAVAAAGRVDRDPVPGGGVEDGHARAARAPTCPRARSAG